MFGDFVAISSDGNTVAAASTVFGRPSVQS